MNYQHFLSPVLPIFSADRELHRLLHPFAVGAFIAYAIAAGYRQWPFLESRHFALQGI
jgi:hypothetical protein